MLEVAEAIRLIERDGWMLVGMRGSHRQYKHGDTPGVVTIAGAPSKDLPQPTWHSILKQAELK
jgi:predicted RNA binding protein YcfA (HicA-like mRNA interferase family)